MHQTMSHAMAADGKLWGRGLRHFLLSVLANAGRAVSVAELVERVDAAPARLSGRASKRVSDALRWEVGRGRVRKVRRGVYEFVGMPRSTRRFVERRVRELRTLLARFTHSVPLQFDPSAPAEWPTWGWWAPPASP